MSSLPEKDQWQTNNVSTGGGKTQAGGEKVGNLQLSSITSGGYEGQYSSSQQSTIEEAQPKLGRTFQFIEKIDGGSFGELYQARDTLTNTDVAVKLERTDAKQHVLTYEAKVLKFLNNQVSSKGFPAVHYCSVEEPYNIMVMELLGPSLEDLFNICNRKFSALTVAMIGLQLTERLEFLHSKYYIHRDVKPDNVCIGRGKSCKTLFMIDMAFCKRFIQKDGSHIPNTEGKQFTGTARYASVNAQRYYEQSRRDDLISLGYSLIYFMRGRLPWQDYKAATKREKYERILEKKASISVDQLCAKLPDELAEFMKYCFSLDFEKKPDYANVKRLFEDMIKKYAPPSHKPFASVHTTTTGTNNSNLPAASHTDDPHDHSDLDFDWNIIAQDVGEIP